MIYDKFTKGVIIMGIMSVRGMISADELGTVSPHEHVFIDLSSFFTDKKVRRCDDAARDKVSMDKLGILANDPYALKDNLIIDDESVQLTELEYFKAAGGSTVVDATTEGIVRRPRELYRLSEATGINIVMGTGWYVRDSHTDFVRGATEEELVEYMLRDIREGVDGTEIKAGVIGEIGVSEYFDENEHKVLRASGIAASETGYPVLVHINPWTTHGIEAADILTGLGVAPEKITICHVDVENRRDYIHSLLSRGVFVEFDNFGKEYYVPKSSRRLGYGPFVNDKDRVKLVCELIKEGYLNQILLCCDVCLKSLLCSYGGQGYAHVLENIVPRLYEEGLTPDEVSVMLKSNPARFLDVK